MLGCAGDDTDEVVDTGSTGAAATGSTDDGGSTGGAATAGSTTAPADASTSAADTTGDGSSSDGSTSQTDGSTGTSGSTGDTDGDSSGSDSDESSESDSSDDGMASAPTPVDDGYATRVDLPLTVAADTGLLANDISDQPLTVVASDAVSALGAEVTVAVDGSFTYAPQMESAVGLDTFQYTVANDAGMATATVTIDVAPLEATAAQLLDDGLSYFVDYTDDSGAEVSAIGDFNGDGLDDWAVVTTSELVDGQGFRVRVLPGKLDADDVDLDGADEPVTFIMDSDAIITFGVEAHGIGDFNDDGFADMIIGNPGHDGAGTQSGRVLVVFGRSDDGEILVSDIVDGTGGFAVTGDAPFRRVGFKIGTLDDFDDDGSSDLLFTSNLIDHDEVNVIFGQEEPLASMTLSEVAAATEGFIVDVFLVGAEHIMRNAGDVDGDGDNDLIFHDTWLRLSLPLIYNFEFDTDDGMTLGGILQPAGDVNGDSISDVAVVGHSIDGESAQCVLFGGAGMPLGVDNGVLGGEGFCYEPSAAYNFSVGLPVGDITGDGLADRIMGAPTAYAFAVGGIQEGVVAIAPGVDTSEPQSVTALGEPGGPGMLVWGGTPFQLTPRAAQSGGGLSIALVGLSNSTGFWITVPGALPPM